MQPKYDYGEEVRVARNVRNDGTYPGKEVGELLLKRGAIGCVNDVGTYLQDQLIYRVNFLGEGKTVGCREEELIPASAPWVDNKFEFNQKVLTKIPITVGGETVVQEKQQGLIMKVLRDIERQKIQYHVHFSNRVFQMPEAALEQFE
ncbi:nitrogen fixation protein NifZ [Alteromonadaceae bacterium Bs31]|nr:nitrogen fixation protein NifZ [Alteromonadaceae bacterium Bs31]